MKTIMTQLGENIGTMFAKIHELFARKGNVSSDFDTLEKIESFIKRLNTAVFQGTAENQLDTLAEISAFLSENKDKILTAGQLNPDDVVNNLTSDATQKPLAAAQGKILKNLIDNLQQSIAASLTTARQYTDTKTSEITQNLTELSEILSNKANQSDVCLKTELGTTDEFTAAFNLASGETFK